MQIITRHYRPRENDEDFQTYLLNNNKFTKHTVPGQIYGVKFNKPVLCAVCKSEILKQYFLLGAMTKYHGRNAAETEMQR